MVHFKYEFRHERFSLDTTAANQLRRKKQPELNSGILVRAALVQPARVAYFQAE